MSDAKISGEKFKELAVDMMPVIKNMEDVLKKHGVENLASLTVSTDGYFTFSHNGTGWDFIRVYKDDTPSIRINYGYEEKLEWRE